MLTLKNNEFKLQIILGGSAIISILILLLALTKGHKVLLTFSLASAIISIAFFFLNFGK